MRLSSFQRLLAAWGAAVSCNALAADIDQTAQWPLCPPDFIVPQLPAIDATLGPDDVYLSADQMDIVEVGISRLTGDVVVSSASQAARADRVDYDQAEQNADLEGSVQLWDQSVYLASERAHVELDEDTGTFTNAEYMLPLNRGRGQASQLFHEVDKITRLENVDYTTCSPGAEFWKLSAGQITLNHQTERGTARNVVLRIKNVPVFYTPYLWFPLSKKRKTGFLFPGIGSSSQTGAELRTPFYINIAPNMDATITPRLMEKRGAMLIGEYRYLFTDIMGQIDAEYLPSDDEFDDDDRKAFGLRHNQSFLDQRGRLDIDYAWVSDREYLQDFGTTLSITSTRYLQQKAETQYHGDWFRFLTRVQGFQSVDPSVPLTPYKRLPQVRFDTLFPDRNRRLNFQFRSEAAYFTRDAGPPFPDDPDGARLDIMPHVNFPVRTLGAYLEPKAGLRYTQYSLENNNTFKSSPSRVLPFFSLDSGAIFERPLILGDANYLNTLEPRLYYLYIPHDEQDDLPVFDTGLYDFSFAQLFREDRFNGPDRMGDANQVTAALTSRLIDQAAGRELGRLSIGQIYYLRDREVTLPNEFQEDEDTSPIVGEIGTRLVPDWDLLGTIQWDPNDERTEKLSARASYQPGNGRVVNLAYRVRRDERARQRTAGTFGIIDIEQTDVSFRWPLNPSWNVVGRWNYALPESKSLELFGGLEYESCCWAFRAVARRFLTDIDGDYNTGIFFQIELKGLGGLGRQAADFLERNIRGYEPDF